MTTMLRGTCRCESVQYQVEDSFRYAFYCHCNKCRRISSSAFKAIAGLPFDKLSVTRGAEHTMRIGDADGTHDIHCRSCGSFLFSYIADNGFAHVGLGTLLDTPSIRPDHHIFVAFKAPWHEITDSLPQYETLPP